MIWDLLLIGLRKTWPYFLGAALILGLAWWVHHRGYESGYAASEGKWQPRFDAAEHALTAANEKARRTEEDSKLRTQELKAAYDAEISSLNSHAADASRRIHDLSLRIAAASASRCTVPAMAGSSAGDAGAAGIGERAQRASDGFRDAGAKCLRDAARLKFWTHWYPAQKALRELPQG